MTARRADGLGAAEAARLHRAEQRWLQQCAARLAQATVAGAARRRASTRTTGGAR